MTLSLSWLSLKPNIWWRAAEYRDAIGEAMLALLALDAAIEGII